jgi:hypothetical protein
MRKRLSTIILFIRPLDFAPYVILLFLWVWVKHITDLQHQFQQNRYDEDRAAYDVRLGLCEHLDPSELHVAYLRDEL